MDLIGGYGSDEESDGEQPTRQTLVVDSAPAPSSRPVIKPEEPSEEPQEYEWPRLVAPQGPLVQDDDDDMGMGPSRPPTVVITDTREIPGISNPEVWSKLPAPKAVRRVVQLTLPIHKALLKQEDDSDEDDAAAARARKRAKQAGGGGKALLDFLPAPKNAASGGGFGAGGGMIDLGDSEPDSKPSLMAGLPKPKQQQQQAQRPAVGSNEMYRVQSPTGSKAAGSSRLAGRAAAGLDSDDEDPMARLGPMPDAGSYAAGPIEDDGEEGEDGEAGPSQDASHEQYAAAQQQQQYVNAPIAYAEASAYYVGEDAAAYGVQQQPEQQYGSTSHADDDVGQQLLDQALIAEQQRAAKRGQALDMSSLQFKEVNQKDLTYMTPAQREAQRATREALGSEYAASLRADAKPFEGNKLAKRKHQIGTLFHNAKMKELEILEGKAAGLRAKGETKAKYGW